RAPSVARGRRPGPRFWARPARSSAIGTQLLVALVLIFTWKVIVWDTVYGLGVTSIRGRRRQVAGPIVLLNLSRAILLRLNLNEGPLAGTGYAVAAGPLRPSVCSGHRAPGPAERSSVDAVEGGVADVHSISQTEGAVRTHAALCHLDRRTGVALRVPRHSASGLFL